MTLEEVMQQEGEVEYIEDERSVALLNTEYFFDPSGPFRVYILTSSSTYGSPLPDPQLWDKLEKIL